MLQRSTRSRGAAGGGAPESDGPRPDRQPRGNAAAAEALQDRTVQALDGKASKDAPALAEKGDRAASGRLPSFDRLQASFGKHDISGIRVAIGGKGGETADQMGAEAYASGDVLVFQSNPDLHTVAHEVAHVVQQRNGVRKAGGVGSPGDTHEQQADRVADLVVAGKNAEAVLDGHAQAEGEKAGGQVGKTKAKAGETVQMLPTKKVASGAMRRLEKAKEAIKFTKELLSFGAGNQYDALKASNFNSYFRMKAMRDPECWELAPSVRGLASQHPDALTAAKAELGATGNCGEHAQIGFDYLRATAVGETINRCDKEGLDHAFVIMGDVPNESDASLTVCDPWPTAATACLWEDHFAHTSDKEKLNVRRSEVADGSDVKSLIAAGLKLSPKGEQMIKMSFDDERTEEELKKGTSRENGAHPWIWRHPNAAAQEYDYQEETGS